MLRSAQRPLILAISKFFKSNATLSSLILANLHPIDLEIKKKTHLLHGAHRRFFLACSVIWWVLKMRHRQDIFSQQFHTRICCHYVACMLRRFGCWPATRYSMATRPRSTGETLRCVTVGPKKKQFLTFCLIASFFMMPEPLLNALFNPYISHGLPTYL